MIGVVVTALVAVGRDRRGDVDDRPPRRRRPRSADLPARRSTAIRRPVPPRRIPAAGPTWSAVVDRIPLGVVVMASSGQVLYRNASAKAVIGTYTGLLIDDAVQAALREALARRTAHASCSSSTARRRSPWS